MKTDHLPPREMALTLQEDNYSLFKQLVIAKQRIEELECALEAAKADSDYWFHKCTSSRRGAGG